MIEWWVGLTGWLKYGVPIALLLISIILYFMGYLWSFGFGMGFILLIGSLCFKDDPIL
jgi:hypothetical protein